MKQDYLCMLTQYLRTAQILREFVSTDPYDRYDFLITIDSEDSKAIHDGFTIDSYSFAFILEARARRLKEKDYDYNPFIISNIEGFVEQLAQLSITLKESETRRFDIIAQATLHKHATAMSFFVSNKKIERIYIDPSLDPSNEIPFFICFKKCQDMSVSFSSHGYQNASQSLQSDHYSCLPYAESLLHKMHRMSLDELKTSIPKGQKFENIAPCFMKYTQSTEIMAEYMTLKPLLEFGLSKKYSYAQLEQKQFRETITSSSYACGIEKLETKLQNRGMDFLRESRLKKAVDLIKTLSEEEVGKIVKNRVNSPSIA